MTTPRHQRLTEIFLGPRDLEERSIALGPSGGGRDFGAEDLGGLRFATNLRILALRGIGSGLLSLDELQPATDRSVLPGQPVGTPDLEFLSVDFANLAPQELGVVKQLRDLRFLSLDTTPSGRPCQSACPMRSAFQSQRRPPSDTRWVCRWASL